MTYPDSRPRIHIKKHVSFSYPLPDSPPLTPPALYKGQSPITSTRSNMSSQRHPYSNGTPGAGPSPIGSPSNLPGLLPDDPHDQLSPSSEASIVTPIGADHVNTTPKMASEHFMLSSFAHMSTPELVIPQDLASRGFPLLPPHHPLRSKMHSQPSSAPSTPPHTPKGHPLSTPGGTYFSFGNTNQAKTRPAPYQYHQNSSSYTTTLTYFLRIPRRLRPVLLVAVCILTFGLVMLSRAMSLASHMEYRMASRPTAFARRFVEISGMNDINAKDQYPLVIDAVEKARLAEAAVQSKVHSSSGDAKGLVFENTQEELAALISFITSTTANALPDVDPTNPMDPSVILDFDPAHPNAKQDLELLQKEVNALYPLVLFGKMRDPWHREIKRMLAEYKIKPSPLIVDVDQRNDHSIFIPVLARLLGTTDLPQLLLQGEALGSYHEVLKLRETGTLQSTLEESGAVTVREIKKKKKGVKERERLENERILGPAPIVEAL
ncbi:hypothetical protein IAR55_000305 [Kwoniella newhampshirensis]|uniref:Glutathione transferase n=1 Tax=Kwoniella newhampshirensis TaxID=1651941 RepID=A0AAW0Z6B1_9TREE